MADPIKNIMSVIGVCVCFLTSVADGVANRKLRCSDSCSNQAQIYNHGQRIDRHNLFFVLDVRFATSSCTNLNIATFYRQHPLPDL